MKKGKETNVKTAIGNIINLHITLHKDSIKQI